MILTVTCNPALDVTYEIEALSPGAVHRVRTVTARPGGKSVNVATIWTPYPDGVLTPRSPGRRGWAATMVVAHPLRYP